MVFVGVDVVDVIVLVCIGIFIDVVVFILVCVV